MTTATATATEPSILVPDGRSMRRASEVASATGLSLNTILRAVERGEVRGVRVGRSTLVPLPEVARLLGLGSGEQLVPDDGAEVLV